MSPDGSILPFFRGTELQRVELAGGTPVNLAGNGAFGIAWLSDDVLVFPERAGRRQISRIPGNGGTPAALVTLDAATAVPT